MKDEEEIKSRIAELPKGTISKKTIQGKIRYYQQWREGDKVKSKYIKPEDVDSLVSQIELRRHLQEKLLHLQVLEAEAAITGISTRQVAEPEVPYLASTPLYQQAQSLTSDILQDDFFKILSSQKRKELNQSILTKVLKFFANNQPQHQVPYAAEKTNKKPIKKKGSPNNYFG